MTGSCLPRALARHMQRYSGSRQVASPNGVLQVQRTGERGDGRGYLSLSHSLLFLLNFEGEGLGYKVHISIKKESHYSVSLDSV